jgi:flagella basal body P-ring formation protein FlgA
MIWNMFLGLAFITPQGQCAVLQHERIYAREVALLIPEFAALPGDLTVGYAPDPGERRILTRAMLAAVARSYGLQLESGRDLCFELHSRELRPEEIRAAMLEEFQRDAQTCGIGDGIEAEVLEWGPERVPDGQITFPSGCSQLLPNRGSRDQVLWRGYVSYGTNRRLAIWARTRITINITRVEAVSDIVAGTPIRQDQVRVASAQASFLDDRQARGLEEVVGYASRKPVRAGTALGRSELYRLPEVGRGDTVQVRVTAGATRLALEGRAESAGSIGAMVWIKNPTSGKSFRAKVVGKGLVAVSSPSGGILEE